MKNVTISATGILFLLLGTLASAQVTTYCCDQAAEDAYLAALAAQHPSATVVNESFESGSWVNVRSPIFSPSVSNLGITWSQNDDGLTTNNFNSSDGNYQMFTYDAVFTHTEPDGYTITGDNGVVFGVGGWFSGTGTKLSFVVDGDPNRVNFTGEEATVSNWTFLGLIDTTPFASVEVVRVDEVGNETNWFWSDDFNIATQEGPGALQFSATGYSVGENGTSITITVERVAGSAGAVSVGYATSDGSATASADYTPASGTLNFADGVTTQTFSVDILDDTSYEGDEDFTVTLSGATGGATLGSPSTATVTITENDPAPPAGTVFRDAVFRDAVFRELTDAVSRGSSTGIVSPSSAASSRRPTRSTAPELSSTARRRSAGCDASTGT